MHKTFINKKTKIKLTNLLKLTIILKDKNVKKRKII